MMESYWPTVLNDPSSNEKDRAHAQWLANVGAIHFQKGMNIGDIVVSIGAMRMDGTGRYYAHDGYPATSDHFLTKALFDEALEKQKANEYHLLPA